MFLIFFGSEPSIILKLFLIIEGVIMSEDQRIISKSLLMSDFIIKQNKAEQNHKYCFTSAKVNLQAVL